MDMSFALQALTVEHLVGAAAPICRTPCMPVPEASTARSRG